jgi:hypothetical protein
MVAGDQKDSLQFLRVFAAPRGGQKPQELQRIL